MNRSLSNVVVGLLMTTLIGCGFHLRGSANLPESLKLMYIQGINVQQGLGRDLKRSLISNGAIVVNDYQQGSAVLTVLDNKFERRVLSVGSNAKVNEYELYGVVKFKVSDGSGNLLSAPQSVEARRDYRFDENQVLASDSEEAQLRTELNQQLVQGILRRLSAIK